MLFYLWSVLYFVDDYTLPTNETLNSLYTGYLVKEYGFDYTTAYLHVSTYNIFIQAGFYKTLRNLSRVISVYRCLIFKVHRT